LRLHYRCNARGLPVHQPPRRITLVIFRSKVTAQISVPAAVRRKLGIGPGSVLEWANDGDQIVVRHAGRFSSQETHRALFGGRAMETKSVDQLERAFAPTSASATHAGASRS